jgi:dienelactone hydrolase
MVMTESNRRAFLQSSAVLAAGLGVGANIANASDTATEPTSSPSFRDRLLTGLGGPWPEGGDLKAKLESTTQKEGYRIERVSYLVEPDERIAALVLIPDGVSSSSPAPSVCVWHQHNGEYHLGKSEPAGLAGNPMHHTGAALAKLGYVVFCPDAQCFEERQDADGKLKGGNYERYEFLKSLVAGRTMAWKNILDMRRGIDYLVTRPDVNADALGCYGHSMGSTHAWLVGPWEPRLKCLIGNCCLPTYAAIHRTKILHCFPNFIPGIYPHGDTPDIAALIAPRALHLNFGGKDGGSPIEEVREGIKTIAAAYAAAGAAENFTAFIEEDAGHDLTDAMWQQVQETFQKHLPAS